MNAPRPLDRDDPQEREAALRMLRMLADPRLTIDDILAHAVILRDVATAGDEWLAVSVGGIPMRCRVDRDPRPPEER